MGFWAALPLIAKGVWAVLGGAGSGAAKDRESQNDAIARNNNAKAALYSTQQGGILRAIENLDSSRLSRAGVDLQRRGFALNAPTVRANQSARGSVLANAQDASISGLPSRIQKRTISGGLRPSMLGGETRALGQEMMAKALRDQMAGDSFEDIPETDFMGGLIAPPTLDGYKEPGTFESFASGAGIIGGILEALSKVNMPRRTVDYGFENRNGQTVSTPFIPGTQWG